LRLYLEDRPLKNARRTTPSERAYRWCRRNPLVAALSVAAATLLLAVVVVSTGAAIRQRKSNEALGRELKNVESAKKEAMKQLARAEISDRDKSEKLWEANLATARASRYSGRSGRRFDSLAALAQAADLGRQLEHSPERFAKLRNEAIAALALPDLQITKSFGQWTSDLVSVDVNADFDLFATSDQAGRCVIRRVADDVEVARLPPPDRPRMILFGADRWLADMDQSGAKTVRIWDVATPVPGLRIDDPRPMTSLDFRPDGGLVAILHADGSLATHELPSGKRRHELPPRPVPQEPTIRLHPTLPYLILTSRFSTFPSIIDLKTGASAKVQLPWPDGRSARGEWSDDGRTLAVPGDYGQGVAFFEFSGDPPVARFSRSSEGIQGRPRIVLNQSGDRLFSRGDNVTTIMKDLITGRVLVQPPAYAFLPISLPMLKTDRERRRLFPARVDDPVRRFGYWSVAEGQECRLIVPETKGTIDRWVGISPDGRLAMGVSGQKVHFYDMERGREAGGIPFGDLGTWNFYVAMDPSGWLLTNTFGGCLRWPIRPDPITPGTVVIGPPERLDLPPWDNMTASSRDGTVIAQARMGGSSSAEVGGWLLRPGGREPARNLHPGLRVGQASVTPDGKWVMYGGSPGPVFVHDAESGKLVWSMPGENGRCLFSPNGKWLGTDIDNGRLFEVGTWQPGPRLGHGFLACFSPDGTLAVLSTGERTLRLVEVATGREVARFEDPDSDCEQAALSADNATLVANHKDGLRVWDLRLIRSELSKIGLDWDAPALPPRSKPEEPLTVKIVGADRLDPRSTASRVRKILTFLRNGNRADALLTVADELVQSGRHGLGLAVYNVALLHLPTSSHLRMHRGMELFRQGRWEPAANDFRLTLAVEPPCRFKAQASIRLAWAYHELGKHAEAASTLAQDLETSTDTRQNLEKAGLRLLLAEFRVLEGKPELARKEREIAEELHSKPAEAANNLAWGWLVTQPGSPLGGNERNIPAALFMARLAVELEPDEAMYGNTHGLALYRSERIAEAKSVLDANLILGKATMDAWDLFPLAMCQHRLGEREEAQVSYDKAITWRKGHVDKLLGDARELDELQAEAGRLLKVLK
jgi:WD40 repeat protein/tetratricopeptide (TPR) repeat protein